MRERDMDLDADTEVRFYYEGGDCHDARGSYALIDYLPLTIPPLLARRPGERVRHVVIVRRVMLSTFPPQIFPRTSVGGVRLPAAMYDGLLLVVEGTSYSKVLRHLLAIIAADQKNRALALSGVTSRKRPEDAEKSVSEPEGTRRKGIRRGHLVLVHSQNWPAPSDEGPDGGDTA